MATAKELTFIEEHGPYRGLRVLEVGSGHSHSRKVRALTKEGCHIGLDVQHGEFVEVVHDLTDPLDIEPFNVVLCCSVLEHCSKPWRMAENIEKLLLPGGLLIVSAPFQWRVHSYPSDYFRFTFYGLEVLFQNIEFSKRETDPAKADLGTHTHGHVLLMMSGRKK